MAAKACPRDPPPPPGFAYWKGPVPTELGLWAQRLLKVEGSVNYGYVWTTEYSGRPIAARKDHHTWTYRGGHLITGICIPGITLYRPIVLGEAVQTVDPTVPDPDLAMYNEGAPTDWVAVGISGGAILGLALLFAAALKYAGRR